MTATITPPPEQARSRSGTSRPGPGRRLARSWSRHWYAYAMVTPVVVVLATLVAWPLLRGVLLSLTDATTRTIGNPRFGVPDRSRGVGLRHYADVLGDSQFWTVLLRTVVWTGSCVLLHYGIGLVLAVALNRELRFRGAYRLLLVLPWAVPAFVSTFAWRFLLNTDSGLVNAALAELGLGRPDWLGQSNLVLVAVVAVNVWLGVPFMMVALLGGLQAIPAELYEAAEMDGAGPWQRFRHVTLPGLRPVSATVVLLGTVWTFNMFPVIYLMAGRNEYAQILVTYSYDLFASGQLALAATYGVLILSILVVFASAYQRALRTRAVV